MLIKTFARCHFPPSSCQKSKSLTKLLCWKDYEKTGILIHFWWKLNNTTTMEGNLLKYSKVVCIITFSLNNPTKRGLQQAIH